MNISDPNIFDMKLAVTNKKRMSKEADRAGSMDTT